MENILTADYIEQGTVPAFAQKTTSLRFTSSDISARLIHCDVVFGSPKEDCRGTGICRIATSYQQANLSGKKECRHAPALMCSNPEGTCVTLLFRQSDLCTHLTRHYFFQKKHLEIKHSCSLPTAVVIRLGIQGSTLPVGKHKVSFGGGYYRIDCWMEG